jgi:hypothetical protein
MPPLPITDKQKNLIIKINIELGVPIPEDLHTWSRFKASSYIDDRIKESKKAREFARDAKPEQEIKDDENHEYHFDDCETEDDDD